jgi:hypothetical protein
MAIAQMNWGRLQFPLTDSRMAEFDASLEDLYLLAEAHPGFIWRIPDGIAADQLQVLNFDERISATVSVWDTVEALKDYTFESLHGDYLKRAGEWFEAVDGPQLVIWNVDQTNRPSFREAFNRLEILKRDGPTDDIYGWPS